ncbi:MAG: RagB/SusD family nutrient uptake outer membrane protein [Sphingobacteriaceae bacterium]|nr:RagB/SusD family nutrient uptake outer membrane protein [Cytophagaceae bacterium]
MNRKHILSALLLAVALGCSQSALDKVNPNQVTTEQYFKNNEELLKGVNSVYALLQSYNLWGREYFFSHDLRSDDVASGGGQLETPRNQLLNGVHDAGNGVSGSVWNGLYRLIHRANVVVDKSANVTVGDVAARKRIVAEAKFLRSLAYFDLVSQWGAVPLYKNFVASTDGFKARDKEEDVYAFIVADLQAAQTDLPAAYTGADLGRATKGAAQTLLARVHLQRGQYAEAKAELQKVISSGQYKLMDNFSDNFLEETEFNAESIFEVGFSKIGDFNWDGDGNDNGANETVTRSQEYSPIGWRNLIPSNSLLAEYETVAKGDAQEDPRVRQSMYFIGDKFNGDKDILDDDKFKVQGNSSTFDGKTQKVSWRKYSHLYKSTETYYTSGINFRVMRYAEVLLMMAEAENEVGSPATALTFLNQVRARKSVALAPYPTKNYPANSKDEVFRAVVHEKRVELAGEQIRNRDLLRWRKLGKLKTEPLTYFQKGKHELLPIPQSEIDNNTAIGLTGQNPGY